jgi:predicted aspartyl protease
MDRMSNNKFQIHVILFVILIFLPGCTAINAMKLVSSGEAVPNNYRESVVPFTLEGHPMLIKARLNNSHKEYIFIFDTGALTMVRQEVAKELGLPKGLDVEANDISGKSKTIDLVKLDNIIVGNMEVRDCAVGVTDFSEIFAPKIAGILGSNFFRHFKVTIDFRDKEVIFSREKNQTVIQNKEIIFPFKTDIKMGFAPVIKCEVGGEIKDTAIIDTGFPGIVALPLSTVKKTRSFKEGDVLTAQGNMTGGMFGVTGEDYILRIDELKVGNLKLRNIPSTSHSLKDGHLLLGIKFLEKFLVSLNYPAEEMILTPYGTPFETNIPSYGLALAKEDHKTIVSGIWDNSSASQSGIKPGNEVVTIDSKETRTLSIMELMGLFFDEGINSLKVEYINDKGRQKCILHKEMLLPVLK